MQKNKQKGFSLIELLVVIGIIGMMASLILVGVSKARSQAKNARIAQDINRLNTAMELYYSKNGQYPTTVGNYQPLIAAGYDLSTYPNFIQNLVTDRDINEPVKTISYTYLYVNFSQFTPSALGSTIAPFPLPAISISQTYQNMCPLPNPQALLVYAFDGPSGNPSDILTSSGYIDSRYQVCSTPINAVGNCHCYY